MAKRKATTAKKTVILAASAAQHTPQIQLRDLRLFKSACVHGVGRVPELEQQIKLTIRPNPDKPNTVIVRVEFVLSGKAPDGQEGLRIEATFAALYEVESLDKFTPDQVAAFLPSIALGNVWPYWREFVQSTTVRMGLPPLRVPLLRPNQISGTKTIREGTPKTPLRENARKEKKNGR
jgi:preprotein translocase subunit SecB